MPCRHDHSGAVLLLALLPAVVALSAATPAAGQMREYPTQYYVIHSDLDEPVVHEAALRITKMAEEYARRSQAFAGRITKRLPFYLFRNYEDYLAAGGLPGSAGMYDGRRLMAVAGTIPTPPFWKVVQHEGYHQFVHAVITGEIPVWVNEGMAEYFGEAEFTGDGMVTGLIPQSRLMAIKTLVTEGHFKSVEQMMLLPRAAWNHEMRGANYDQAWSMVHFLVHVDDGRLQARFEGFLRDVGNKRLEWKRAWAQNFGTDVADFEKAWRTYWLEMPDHPTRESYAEANVATITSFLARGSAAGQRFRDLEELARAARLDKLEFVANDWLPPSLLKLALLRAGSFGKYELLGSGGRSPKVRLTMESGLVLTGSFKLNGKRVRSVSVVRPGR